MRILDCGLRSRIVGEEGREGDGAEGGAEAVNEFAPSGGVKGAVTGARKWWARFHGRGG